VKEGGRSLGKERAGKPSRVQERLLSPLRGQRKGVLLFLLGRALALVDGAGVGGAVELDEEVEVGPDDEAGEEVSVTLVAAAVLGIHVVVEHGGGVGDEDNDELRDLDSGDVALPPDFGSGADDHEEVVPVPCHFQGRKQVFDDA